MQLMYSMKFWLSALILAISAPLFASTEPTTSELDTLRSAPDARSHFRLGMIYAQNEHHRAALRELSIAQHLDPSLSFVRSPEYFETIIMVEQDGAHEDSKRTHQNMLTIAIFAIFLLITISVIL